MILIFLLVLLTPLEEAQQQYILGLKAETIAERSDDINKSLNIYLNFEKNNEPENGNGKLYYEIGNSLYALEQYPWAIWYFYKALKLMPNNASVRNNLNLALDKQFLPHDNQKSWYKKIFYLFPLPRIIQIIFVLTILTFILYSTYVWMNIPLFQKLSYFFGFLVSLFFIFFLLNYYLTPVEAVIVKSSQIYKGPSINFQQVNDKPLTAGSKIEILDVLENGSWLKLKTAENRIGYIPHDKVRLI